jgi:hypothetical protein
MEKQRNLVKMKQFTIIVNCKNARNNGILWITQITFNI